MRGARQINSNGGSLPKLTVNRNGPASLLGKPVNHAQPEAGALAYPLRGKERLKGTSADLLAHAGSRVSHGDYDIITWIEGRKPAEISVSHVLARNGQFATRRHGVPRIDSEIEDGQLQLGRLGHRPPGIRVEKRLDLDRRPDCTGQHLARF